MKGCREGTIKQVIVGGGSKVGNVNRIRRESQEKESVISNFNRNGDRRQDIWGWDEAVEPGDGQSTYTSGLSIREISVRVPDPIGFNRVC